jgi:hypothetical protein
VFETVPSYKLVPVRMVCMKVYIHTYIHTYDTYIHKASGYNACIHTYVHTCIQASGFGCESIADKEEYRGQFVKGKRARRGVLIRDDGITISGMWIRTHTYVNIHICMKGSPYQICEHTYTYVYIHTEEES